LQAELNLPMYLQTSICENWLAYPWVKLLYSKSADCILVGLVLLVLLESFAVALSHGYSMAVAAVGISSCLKLDKPGLASGSAQVPAPCGVGVVRPVSGAEPNPARAWNVALNLPGTPVL